MGTVLGCLLSFFGLKFLVAAIPEGLIPREAVIRLNLPVLLFSLGDSGADHVAVRPGPGAAARPAPTWSNRCGMRARAAADRNAAG